MNKYKYLSIIFSVAFVFLSACERAKMNARTPQSQKKKSDKAKNTLPACYLNTCFDTTRMGLVEDPKNDYVYPNPDNFPNETLRPQYVPPFAILDLKDLDPKTRLAANFRLDDFMSLKKGRYGLYSSDVVTTLQLIRNEVRRPVYITSGYRSPGYNRNIDGAATWSRHTYGDAVDFYIQNTKIADHTAFCERHGASFSLTYPKHIHCDWRKTPLDPSFYHRLLQKGLTPTAPNFVANLMAMQSQLIVEEQNGIRYLRVEIPIHEDEEGDPTHAWVITLPNGETLRSNSTIVQLPNLRGNYKIAVVVGGSIHIEESLNWQ